MEPTRIHGTLSEAHRLCSINKQLSKWDLSAVEGRGSFVGGQANYGHVQIKMYGTSERESKMIWNLTSSQLPYEIGAIKGVEEALSFFLSYLDGIRGESTHLIIEVNDGSYHPVDSKAWNYKIATIYAIVDCFNKDAIQFKEHRLRRC